MQLLRATAVIIHPVMPEMSLSILRQMGYSDPQSQISFSDLNLEARLPQMLSSFTPLFQRIEKSKENT